MDYFYYMMITVSTTNASGNAPAVSTVNAPSEKSANATAATSASVSVPAAEAGQSHSAPLATRGSVSASNSKGKTKITDTTGGTKIGISFRGRNVGHGLCIDEANGSMTYNVSIFILIKHVC